VIVAKQRHGPVGIVRLSFEGQFTKFGNLAADIFLSTTTTFSRGRCS